MKLALHDIPFDPVEDKLPEPKIAYWKTRLHGIGYLKLPSEYDQLAFKKATGVVNFTIGKALWHQIKTLSEQHNETSFTVLLTAFKTMLYRYTAHNDICIGTTMGVQGRSINQSLDTRICTLPLRSHLDGEISFIDLLKQVGSTISEALDNKLTSFDEVLDELAAGSQSDVDPFGIMFVMHPQYDANSYIQNGMKANRYNNISSRNFTLRLTEIEERLHGTINFRTDLTSEQTMRVMPGHYLQLLDSIVRTPWQKIGALPMLTYDDKKLFRGFNNTLTSYPAEKSLVDLFEEQVQRTPHNIALIHNGLTLTYSELNERANRLARYLIGQGVERGSNAGLIVNRGFDMIIGMYAILKAGGAYIPIDPDYPVERQNYILKQSSANLVLSDADSPLMDLIPEVSYINFRKLDLNTYDHDDLKTQIDSRQLAYTIYTSGSTGVPKGVMIEHHSVVNLIQWVNSTFAVSADDRLLFITSMCFDLSVYDIFGLLSAGGSVVIASQQDLSDTTKLKSLLLDHRITFWDSVPTTLNYLIRELKADPDPYIQQSLRLVFLSGDWIPVQLPEEVKEFFPNARVISLGGATEGTIWSNYYPVEEVKAEWKSIPYGKPIANNFFYILNEQLQQVPPGVTGELYIGGVGVARGYANDREKTEHSFVRDPFNNPAGGRMYRTGDLGRLMGDGNMEFLGRKDTQVKIRGYRVELGEIESVLNQSELVNQAVVLAKTNDLGNKNLIAYIVPNESIPDQAVILSYLKNRLPEYMVPALLVQLEQFPLTSNGKIDKKALLEMDVSAGRKDDDAPANQTQMILAEIWTELLGVRTPGISNNFFELGGHSLTALRLIASIRSKLDFELTIRDLFLYPTIKELSGFIESQKEAPDSRQIIKVDPRPEHIPLSFNQESLWFIDQLKGSLQYHIPIAFRIEGELNRSALTRALQTIISRHEVLRTVIRETDGKPWQFIISPEQWKLKIVNGHEQTNDPEFLQKSIDEIISEPFDLANDYMLRACLICISNHEHILVITQHHIASDGWSGSILITEMTLLYKAFIDAMAYQQGKDSALPLLNLQYADYAIWQRTRLKAELYDQNINYWKEKLHGLTPLTVPADYPRPLVQSTKGAVESFVIDRELSDPLLILSQNQGVTLFMSLLAAFKVLLYRYTYQNDICVGTAVAGRDHKEIENLMGYFINTLALRSQVNEDSSFITLLHQLKATTMDALDHQQVSFDQVVAAIAPERNLRSNPLFQIMFILQNLPEIDALNLGDATLSEVSFQHTTSKFDLSFVITETDSGLKGIVEYSTDLYQPQTIQRMIGHYTELLRSIVNGPENKIADLRILTAAEEHQLLVEFNNTRMEYPKDKTLVDLFEEQALKTPHKIAVISDDVQLTFKELNDLSDRLAFYLTSKGVKEESFVPVCLERSSQMIIGILGILKAGAAYVPISLENPALRINYIVEDLRPEFIICDPKNIPDLADTNKHEIIILDKSLSILDEQRPPAIKSKLKPEHAAYVMYTSGTSGKPKGVVVEHASIANYVITNSSKYVRDSEEGAGSFIHLSFTFDASLASLFIPLLAGRSIVISSARSTDAFRDPLFLKHAPYDFIALTPSHLLLLEDAIGSVNIPVASKLLIGGEALQSKHLSFLKKAQSVIGIINEYGPTETTIGCSSFSFDLNDIQQFVSGNIPIGSPNGNMQAYILNKNGGLVPVGVPGELYISGAGLARQYLNLPELTAEKFISNPFVKGTRMYSTGDICRWLPDGRMEYQARKDDQVKFRGYRIELAEIENTLEECREIRKAAVLIKEDSEGNKRLTAYVQTRGEFDQDMVTGYLKSRLPEYMIPAFWIEIDRFSLTLNGKIDKTNLPDFKIPDHRPNQYVAPRNEDEKALVKIWEESLGVSKVGLSDNFFELGGHSLMAVQIMIKTEQRLGKKLPLSILFKHPTIESLLASFEANSSTIESSWRSLVPIKETGSKMPIYIIHGSGLNVLNFHDIALHVDPEQPVFGLQAKGLGGIEEPQDNMEEIARSYIAEILEHNPSGPYAIAGYSFGGYVAVEMRNQLEKMGKTVKMLAMFDTNAVDSGADQSWRHNLLSKVKRQFPKFLWIMKSLYARPTRTINYQAFLVANFVKATVKKIIRSDNADRSEFYNQIDTINQMHLKAFKNYKLRPFDGTIYLLRAKERVYYVTDFKYLGWLQYAKKGVKVYDVPGDHKTMLLPPNAKDFAHALQHALDNCGVDE